MIQRIPLIGAEMIPKRIGPFGVPMPYMPTPGTPGIPPPRLSDPPSVTPGTSTPGTEINEGTAEAGLFGMSNTTLLFIGLGLIAAIYFIKKK